MHAGVRHRTTPKTQKTPTAWRAPQGHAMRNHQTPKTKKKGAPPLAYTRAPSGRAHASPLTRHYPTARNVHTCPVVDCTAPVVPARAPCLRQSRTPPATCPHRDRPPCAAAAHSRRCARWQGDGRTQGAQGGKTPPKQDADIGVMKFLLQ